MDTEGSLLERLRQQLADLESTQRRRGSTATAGFGATPSPDAAEPGPENGPGSERADSTGSTSTQAPPTESPSTESPESCERSGVPLPFTLDWST